ncbi:hypothetical protein ScPMuIL_017538 [Solemya velum]
MASNSSTPSEVNLVDIWKAVQAQGENIHKINTQINRELSSLRDEVKGSSLSVATNIMRLKTESQSKWKFEGNRVQFSFNSELLEELNQLVWAIDNSKFEYAKEVITEAIEKVNKRNKCIKIADSSEGGWETLRQYETNPIASDTDNESKIMRAESRALTKRKNKAKKQSNQRIHPAASTPLSVASVSMFPQLFRDPNSNPASFSGYPLYQLGPGPQRKGQQGGCYSCGSFEHWRNECPFIPCQQSAKESQNDYIKDEYIISDSINDFESRLTDNYYEYEQDSAVSGEFITTAVLEKNIKSVNEKKFNSDFSCQTIAYSDASGTGYGGYNVTSGQEKAHGMWSESERLKSSTWRELKATFRGNVEDLPDKLKEKITLLPSLLEDSESANTTYTYYCGFLRWKNWVLDNGLSANDVLPAKPIHAAIYLACLVQQSCTSSPVTQAYYSIKWAHSLVCAESPTNSCLVKNILEGAKRQLAVSTRRKDPITPEIMSQMFDKVLDPMDL